VVLGFATPLLLVRHVVTTRISDSFLHTDVGYYAYLLWVYFVRSPEYGFVRPCCMDQPGGRSDHRRSRCHAMRT
jgi:hypothetical protein